MTGIPLSSETQRRLDVLFGGAERALAANLLISQCGSNLPFNENADPRSLERIRFATLKLSNGDLARLREAIESAQFDSRDVLMEAGFGQDVRAHEAWFPDHAG